MKLSDACISLLHFLPSLASVSLDSLCIHVHRQTLFHRIPIPKLASNNTQFSLPLHQNTMAAASPPPPPHNNASLRSSHSLDTNYAQTDEFNFLDTNDDSRLSTTNQRAREDKGKGRGVRRVRTVGACTPASKWRREPLRDISNHFSSVGGRSPPRLRVSLISLIGEQIIREGSDCVGGFSWLRDCDSLFRRFSRWDYVGLSGERVGRYRYTGRSRIRDQTRQFWSRMDNGSNHHPVKRTTTHGPLLV